MIEASALAMRVTSSRTIACATRSPSAASTKMRRAERLPRTPARLAAPTTPEAEAAVSSAPAKLRIRTIDFTIGEWQVSDLAGGTVCPPMELSPNDKPHTDTGANRYEGECSDPGAVPVVHLGECGHVHVVLDDGRASEEPAGTRFSATGCSQPGRFRASIESTPTRVIDAGTSNHCLSHLGAGQTGRRRQGLTEGGELLQPTFGRSGAGSLIVLCPDHTGKIGDGTANKLSTDIKTEYVASIRADVIEDRSRATHPAAMACDPHKAVVLEIGKRKPHSRFGESRYPGQLSSRERAVLAHPVKQQLLVHGPHELRTGSTLTYGLRH